MRRAAVLALGAVLCGCAHTVPGAAVFDPDHRVADAGSVLLGVEQVSDVVGIRLQIDADRSRPVAGGACTALDSVGMAAFVGDGWSGMRVLLFTDGDRRARVVAEAVAVYPDAGTAAGAFTAGAAGARACAGRRALSSSREAAWTFTVGPLGRLRPDTMRWTKQQVGIPLTWICHGEARLRNNAVLQAMACQDDDGAADVVTTLADRMSANVWELSGH